MVRKLTLLCMLGMCLHGLAARADGSSQLVPVKVNIGGVRLQTVQEPLSNGNDTFVPIEALKLFGATWKIDRRDETVTADWNSKNQHATFAIVRPQRHAMLSLDDLARAFGGIVVRPAANSAAKPAANGSVYLLATVERIEATSGLLTITTSFPITANVWMIDDSPPRRGIVDLYGCYLPDNVNPVTHPKSLGANLHIRAAQRNFSTTRVVVQIAPRVYFRVGERPAVQGVNTIRTAFHTRTDSKSTQVVINVGNSRASGGSVQKSASLTVPVTGGAGANATSPPPGIQPVTQSPAAVNKGTAGSGSTGNQAQNPTTTPLAPAGTANTGSATQPTGNLGANQQVPAALTGPPAVTAIQYNALSPTEASIVINAGGTVYPVVHYLSGGSLEIVLHGLPLNLAVPSQNSIVLQNAIVNRIESIQTPEMDSNGDITKVADTRIKIESQRFLGFALDRTANQVIVNLRVPDNADGDLAGKLIVVDPGHGGADTGAQAGGYSEKNIVLLIARKLRTDLEQAGARVVMTRDRDVTVPLASRPALANQIHADFYISIHNDCCSVPNSASGTTTYYHMQDASSRALANSVQQAIAAVSGLPSRGARSDGMLYQHGLEVLRDSNMPAILIEVAYINNEHDRSYLINPAFQSTIASAIVTGLKGYVQGMPQAADAGQPNSKIQIAQGH